MKKRILPLLICIVILLGIAPLEIGNSGNSASNEYPFSVNYGAAIGNLAEFNGYFPIPVSDNPENVKNPWDISGPSLSQTECTADLLFSIENYYVSADGSLWYKVKAAPGYTLPQKLQSYPWIYQDNVNSPLGNSLLLHNEGMNVVFDAEGNAVSSAEIGLYDTLNLTCNTTLTGEIMYQWQIRIGDEWVEIMGEHHADIAVNYSLLSNAVDANNKAYLRCVTRSGSQSVVGDTVTVTVNTYFDYDNYVHPETPESSQTPERTVKAATDVCYITVQFLFENNTQAANSFVAEIPVNKEQSVTAIFPYVQGYLPYYNDVRQDELTINKVITTNEIYTVIYKPTEVIYTVDVYFQNVENDNYSFYDSRQHTGLTGSTVPLNTEDFLGMRELLHETPTIAADGSTHVEVYYDRIYYMTRVYLSGGYGIYSVYARFGADLQSHMSAPTRPGYTFVGWDEYTVDADGDGVPETGGDGIMNVVHPTVPPKNLAYVALWSANPTAPVNIVFWGQEANDDTKYSYLETQPMNVKPGTELTYSLTLENGKYPCGLNNHTHNSGCAVDCGIAAHEHTLDGGCYTLTCTKTSHNHNNCTLTCNHHNVNCYSVSGNRTLKETTKPNRTLTDRGNGIYRYYSNNSYRYYLNIGDKWYCAYNGNSKSDTTAITFNCNHTHDDDCYSCGLKEGTHTHTVADCYELSCTTPLHTHVGSCYSNCIEHTHTNACNFPQPKFEGKDYDMSLWVLASPDLQQTVVVKEDGSTVLNVYLDRKTFTFNFLVNRNEVYSFTERWGADINDRWAFTGSNGVTYPQSNTSWTPSGSSVYTQRITQMMIMPAEDITFSHTTSNNTKRTFNYYVEVLPGEDYVKTLNGVNYKLYQNITHDFSRTYYNDDFFVLTGMDRGVITNANGGSVNLNPNGNITSQSVLNFHYTRSKNKLEFFSGNKPVRTESVLYEQSLESFADYVTPDPPENVEKGSHEFAGWYLNPECTRPAVLNNMTMPAGNLALYAKWEPKYHKVRIVLNKKEDGSYTAEDSIIESGGEKIEYLEVLHGTTVFSGNQNQTPPTPDNGLYKFLGWFYEEDGVELMWDFEHHPIVEDTVIYAKWSSELFVPYTIYYQDQNGKNIADPTEGSAVAGHSLTVKAKVGSELYPDYQTNYFPDIVSHSIQLDVEHAESGVSYIFRYTRAEEKQYTVHYIDKSNNDAEIIPPVVKTSSYAMVTETFKSFIDDPNYKDHVPDAYQKTLVLSSNPDNNHIYFYYTKTETEGVWFMEYLVQNKTDENVYDDHSNSGGVDELGKVIKPVWPVDLSEDGFAFKEAIINDGTTTKTVTNWQDVKGEITKAGLSITVKFDRKRYPFKVIYRNKDTGQEIYQQAIFNTESTMEMFGSTVDGRESPVVHPKIEGFVYDTATNCTIVKDDPNNIVKNIIYVYYTEQFVRIDFKVINNEGGTVTPEYTRVKFVSDLGATCTATAIEGYRFVGWYNDPAGNSLRTKDQTLILVKPEDGWAPATYYAKFEPDVAPLTIERENGEPDQVYVYEIKKIDDPDFVIYVTITGSGSVTIPDMPLAEYVITQQNDWSWRHSDAAISVNHKNTDGTSVKFSKNADTDKWLNGNSTLVKNQRG